LQVQFTVYVFQVLPVCAELQQFSF
jgi:hypothetical protein